MFSVAIIRDRRKVAGDNKPGSLDVRITIDRKSHYISTGIRVLDKHWRGAVVARPDADALNSRLGIIVRRVNEKINESLEQNKPIDVEAIKAYVYSGTVPSTQKDKDCMLEWFRENVPLLNISEGTRKRYWLLCDRLKEFGKLRSWSDLSVETIYEWDAWLHQNVKAQVRKDEEERKGCNSTIYNYHKSLKALLHRAVDFGLIESSPYAKLQGKFSRGDNESVEYLSEEQMQVIINLHPVVGSQMEAVRDLFVFQMFTGLAYSDTQVFDMSDYHKDGDIWIANGKRIKTGVPYVSVLLPPVIDVLSRHNWQTPKICNQKYNALLKTMGTVIGIEHLHTHLARHTFATYMLSNNVKVENLMRMLGHKNINQTMRYAKVLAKDVQSDFEMIGSKLSLQKTIITKTKRL